MAAPKKAAKVEVKEPNCGPCQGTGLQDRDNLCPHCKGTGQI